MFQLYDFLFDSHVYTDIGCSKENLWPDETLRHGGDRPGISHVLLL